MKPLKLQVFLKNDQVIQTIISEKTFNNEKLFRDSIKNFAENQDATHLIISWPYEVI